MTSAHFPLLAASRENNTYCSCHHHALCIFWFLHKVADKSSFAARCNGFFSHHHVSPLIHRDKALSRYWSMKAGRSLPRRRATITQNSTDFFAESTLTVHPPRTVVRAMYISTHTVQFTSGAPHHRAVYQHYSALFLHWKSKGLASFAGKTPHIMGTTTHALCWIPNFCTRGIKFCYRKTFATRAKIVGIQHRVCI